MRYVIKQKIITLSDGFTIKDEAENDCYKVKGKFISLGKKLTLYDMQDNELCFIAQKVLSLMQQYTISMDSQPVMTIRQKLALFSKKFRITGTQGEYTMEGNLIAKDFHILKDGVIVATVSKKFIALADTYTVDVAENENQALMLAVVIVIDAICHSK